MAAAEDVALRIALKDEVSSGVSNIEKSLAGLAAGFLAFETGRRLLGGIADATIELDKQMARLSGAARRAGIDWNAQEKTVKQFTDQLESSSGVIDDFSRESLVRAIDYTKDLGKAMDITRAAADLAAAKDMDLVTATDLLGKAFLGRTEMLGRYGIVVDQNIPPAEKFAAVMAQVNERFGGAAADQLDTYATKLDVMKDRFSDIGEAIGGKAGGFKLVLDDLNHVLKVTALIIDGEFSAAWKEMEAEAAKTELVISLQKVREEVFNLGGEYKRAAEHMKKFSQGWHELSTSASPLTQIKDTADQLNKLFENPNFVKLQDWWDAQSSLGKDIPSPIGYSDEEMDALEADNEEIVLGAVTTTARVESSWKQAFRKAGDESERFGNAARMMADATARGLMAAFRGASESILGQWKWLNEETNGVLKKMAQDFVRYFVDSILESVAGKLVKGILGFLGSLFDTPANDRMAMRQGKDFAHYFTNGARDYLDNNFNVGKWMGSNFQKYYGPQYTGPLSANGIATGGGVTIVINGSMTPEFIHRHIVEPIQRASSGGFNNIKIKDTFSTGKSVLALS